MKDEEIKGRWREYFDKLFNGENEGPTLELDDSFDDTNRRFVRRIQEAEIGEALKRMKGGKAMGPDGIPIEVWRCLGDRVSVPCSWGTHSYCAKTRVLILGDRANIRWITTYTLSTKLNRKTNTYKDTYLIGATKLRRNTPCGG